MKGYALLERSWPTYESHTQQSVSDSGTAYLQSLVVLVLFAMALAKEVANLEVPERTCTGTPDRGRRAAVQLDWSGHVLHIDHKTRLVFHPSLACCW